jgi:flagellin-like protein
MLKRGVSPLIAVVLLVMVVVTLGSLMATWTKDYVQRNIDYADKKAEGDFQCLHKVYFDLLALGEEVQICHNATNKSISFTAENKGSVPITFNIQVLGSNDISSLTSEIFIAPDELNSFDYNYSDSLGNPINLKIFPVIKVKGSTLFECKNLYLSMPVSSMLTCPLKY